MHNHIHDIANILTSTGSLLAAIPAIHNSNPVIKNPSNEDEKPEVTAPEMYVAPGSQYGSAREALAHMVHELHNPQRNAYNDTLDFTYATLAQLLDMLRDPIYQHGLMLDQSLKAGSDNLPFDMVTTFHHIPTGTEVSFSLPAYIKEDKRLDECQRVGASYTYFRRYGLRQALNITDGDDDADQAKAKRDRKGKGRSTASASGRQWLPDVGNPEWEAAERRAIAMGAVPYTPEEIEAAKDQKRCFSPLMPHEIEFLNKVTEPLNGDMTGMLAVYEKHRDAMFEHVRDGDFVLFDEEDQRRALYVCWVTAAEEFSGLKCRHPDDDGFDDDGVRYEDYDKDDDVVIVPDSDCNSIKPKADDADDELLRIQACRASLKESLRNGAASNTSGDPAVDAEGDAAYAKLNEKRGKKDTRIPETKPLIDIPESDLPY